MTVSLCISLSLLPVFPSIDSIYLSLLSNSLYFLSISFYNYSYSCYTFLNYLSHSFLSSNNYYISFYIIFNSYVATLDLSCYYYYIRVYFSITLLNLDRSSEYNSMWFLTSSLSLLISSCTSILTQFFSHSFLTLSFYFIRFNNNSLSFYSSIRDRFSASSKSIAYILTSTTTSNFFLIVSSSLLTYSLIYLSLSSSYSSFFISSGY